MRTVTKQSPFNPHVHGARGFFAAMVFVFHVANSGLPTFTLLGSGMAYQAAMSLQFGVELFFGISGFVIVGAIARASSVRAFLWDRATRIYPVLWISLVAISIAALLFDRWRPPLGDLILNFLAPPPFIHIGQINPAAWSLGYELTFYALVAFAWWLRPRAPGAWLWVAGIAGAMLIVLFPRALLIPAGILIALGRGEGAWWCRLSAMPGCWLLLFLGLWRWVDVTGLVQTASPVVLPLRRWLELVPFMLAAGICGGLALNGIAAGRGALARLLVRPTFQWLGTISYSFYLWHPVAMATVKAVMEKAGAPDVLGPYSQMTFAAFSLPPALVVAHFSQRWLEFGLTRWLRRHGPSEDNGDAAATARAVDRSEV